jgi:TatD DNase family protein
MHDTHCHIDQYPDPLAIAQLAERNGVITIGVTTLPSHFQEGRAFVTDFRYVRLALGLHPLAVEQHTHKELALFKQLLSSTAYIGEVGLDFSRDGKATAGRQQASFQYVLELLQGRPRFLTLHSRGAEARVLEMLTQYQSPTAVFHWYTGPVAYVEKIQANGHYFSINPAMVRSENGRRIIQQISPARALLETDGPYVQLEKRTVLPTDGESTINQLASLWEMDVDALRTQIRSNFSSLMQPIKAAASTGKVD